MTTMADSADRINLAWLCRLRWGAVVGQIATIATAAFLLHFHLPLGWLAAVVATEAAVNVVVRAWAKRAHNVSQAALFGTLAFDIIAVTALLMMSGGAHNPFSFLYLVYIALAAVVLAPRWTWSLVALAAVGSALLFTAPGHLLHVHSGGDSLFALHLQGMWVAFTVAATFIVYFVMRVRRALAARERELADIRAAAERHGRLSALATLAAGAAHELSTPLGTIATIAKELERSLLAVQASDDMVEDARLMRTQVERCRQVLQRLASDSGATMADEFERLSLKAVLEEAIADVGQAGVVRTTWHAGSELAEVKGPRAPLRQTFVNLIKNGWDACVAAGARPEVVVEGHAEGDEAKLTLRDAGVGMTAAVAERAGEPFFTTKPVGEGMGLGLFVARSVTERLGGRLHLHSLPDQGTTVAIYLPKLAQERLP